MADRWMDERDRDWRDRDWRRAERLDRGYGRDDERYRGEDRTWSGSAEDERGAYEDRSAGGRSYGEEEPDYGDRSGQSVYGGEGYVRSGGRGPAYRAPPGQPSYGGQERQFTPQDYTRGRYADYGYAQRQSYGGARPQDYAPSGRGYQDDLARRWDEQRAQIAPQGDDRERERWDERRGDQGGRGEGATEFLHRAGERISSWFRGDNLMRGSRDEGVDHPRRYSADFGREPRWEDPARGHRGRGPKGYQRSDERITEEVHERLTDDPWLDASDIEVEVKNGEVTLSGHVDNRESKHRAERLIEDLSGVRHVQNNLRVNPDTLTGAGRGYGSSALEAEMRRNAEATDPGNNGASGLSGRTSTGAAAERSTGAATGAPADPASGAKR